MIFPSYDGSSIVNLMQSIAVAKRADLGLYDELEGLDGLQLSAFSNIVLLVIDGLGYKFIKQFPDSCIYSHLKQRMTTVAPPTTAAAVTSFLTGLAPQQHALTGWFTHLRELGVVTTVLPYMARVGGPQMGAWGRAIEKVIDLPSFFDQLPCSSFSITPSWLETSVFNRMLTGAATMLPYDGLAAYFNTIEAAVKSNLSDKYIYAYWPGFDAIAHEYGIASRQAKQHFEVLDQSFATLLDQLAGTDTVLMLSSDHGFIDSPKERQIQMAKHPDLKDCLMMPLCGEPRLSYCYVRHDCRQFFEKYVTTELRHAVDLCPSRWLVEQGLFGLGEAHQELLPRVGDYTLVLKDNYVITDSLIGDAEFKMSGFHGGLSADEMYVPLVYAECR